MILNSKDLSKCYGCFACANVCPKNCIELKQNDEGFFMPQVNKEKCVDCELCDKICLIDKENSNILSHSKKPKCFYGYCKDNQERKRSASGGLSYVLSHRCIENGGVVFGVVGKWFEDVHHVCAESYDELAEICGSKNIQSRVGNSFKSAKKYLENGRKVFFTGTPCQIAALYSFLGKDYDNLLTADLICHGVPSQKVLKAYIEELQKKHNSKVIKFGRDETFQYMPVQYIAWFENGEHEILMPKDSLYRKGFLSNLFQRKSCANCKYSVLPRVADITMGDAMFTLRKSREIIDPKNLGVSLIISNSEKGFNALKDIEDNFDFHVCDLDRAVNGNRWVAHGIEENPLRDSFFKLFLEKGFVETSDIIEKSYSDLMKKYIEESKNYKKKMLRNPLFLSKRIFVKIRRKWVEKE